MQLDSLDSPLPDTFSKQKSLAYSKATSQHKHLVLFGKYSIPVWIYFSVSCLNPCWLFFTSLRSSCTSYFYWLMLNFRCTWNGRPCNISLDFKTILTEFGVCYTFNYENPPLSVRESGMISFHIHSFTMCFPFTIGLLFFQDPTMHLDFYWMWSSMRSWEVHRLMLVSR